MPEKQDTSWTTAAELDFIKQLARGKDAIQKLRGYLAGMAKRTDLAGIDVKAVTDAARQQLAICAREDAREDARGIAL